MGARRTPTACAANRSALKLDTRGSIGAQLRYDCVSRTGSISSRKSKAYDVRCYAWRANLTIAPSEEG